MIEKSIPDFRATVYGFPFPNSYPQGTPVVRVKTPWGMMKLGDASGGLCGGMVFASMDYYLARVDKVPQEQTDPVVRFLCRRLLDSWNFPFGVLKYYDGQSRPLASRSWGGVRIIDGLSRLTIEEQWPKIKQSIDSGLPVPLGLVKAHSFSPRKLAQNHQALAYGYSLSDEGTSLSLRIYDPNYPNDDETTLQMTLTDPEAAHPISHSWEGETIRGFFITEYQRAPLPEL